MDTPDRPRPCSLCGGTGRIALLVSVVPCECRSRPAVPSPLDRAIADVGGDLSVRTRKVLKLLGIRTVGQLLDTPRATFDAARHAGPLTIKELAGFLGRLGYRDWPRR